MNSIEVMYAIARAAFYGYARPNRTSTDWYRTMDNMVDFKKSMEYINAYNYPYSPKEEIFEGMDNIIDDCERRADEMLASELTAKSIVDSIPDKFKEPVPEYKDVTNG